MPVQTRQRRQQQLGGAEPPIKRSANASPDKAPNKKRSAFGDITNKFTNVVIDSSKKSKGRNAGGREQEAAPPLERIAEEAATKKTALLPAPSSTSSGSGVSEKTAPSSGETISVCDSTLPSSLPSSAEPGAAKEVASRDSSSSSNSETEYHNRRNKEISHDALLPVPTQPAADSEKGKRASLARKSAADSYDYDRENLGDPFNAPHYATDIFIYYRTREAKFKVGDYMRRQTTLSTSMRAILVDWMVETQESFELNHETLYQAVKMTDIFLDKEVVDRENLQLVGATTLLIASKFDERCPPAIDDFLYICDDAYTREQLVRMEMEILKVLEFDIGMPLSYRYLRRYAKATKASMDTLTLARYILETSLLHYEFIRESEAKIAGAAFLLAIKMRKLGEWGPIHQKYSGYGKTELVPLARRLNAVLKGPQVGGKNVKTIHQKYSHEVFFKVAEIPPLADGAEL